jgi:hypothetical protein
VTSLVGRRFLTRTEHLAPSPRRRVLPRAIVGVRIMIIWGRTEFYDKLILFLRRIYEKGSIVAWFDHRRCINDDDKTAIVRWHDAKLAVITLVRLRGHIIGATRSHDLPEAILADQGAPADHSEISARRTNVIKSVRLNSVGRAHPPLHHVMIWIKNVDYFSSPFFPPFVLMSIRKD